MAGVRELVDLTNVSEQMQSDETKKVSYEQVLLEDAEKWKVTLKLEIINWGDYDIKANELSDNYIKNDFANLVKDKADERYVNGVYYIKDGNLKDKTYIYDKVYDKVYKIPVTRISKYKVHSVHELDYQMQGGERIKTKVNYTAIKQNVELKEINGLKYYEPDVSNLAKEVTDMVFYKINASGKPTSTEKLIKASDWINGGKKNQITDDTGTYILYDYANQMWANIRIETSSIITYWTWIPRYAYQISGTTTNIAFIDTQGNKLNGEEGEYTELENFKDNTRKGMWVSKYEPTSKSTTNTTAYSYYIPDMKGLDKENTYLEIYDNNAENFVDEVKLSTITNLSKFSQSNNWFDYYNKRWANIKIVENEIETWWVWIPRYAYNNSGDATDIIFIDTTNKPIDGSNFSTSYTVPEIFKGNEKRGIWVSKYEPTSKPQIYIENIKNVPDVSSLITNANKNKIKVYLEIYNEEKTGFEEQIELTQTTNLQQIAKQKRWYDYTDKAWANVKVVNTQGTSSTSDDIETWWVWIPRYAYNNMNDKTDIVLLDVNNKTPSEKNKPNSYVLPEIFKGNQKKGIWVSKYEPIEK